jgi:hypothetical protein
MYRLDGIDTSRFPDIEVGATTNEVLAELQRVEARLLTGEQDRLPPGSYLQAEISPALLANSQRGSVTVRMEFYFDNGRLLSRRDTPKWEKIANP